MKKITYIMVLGLLFLAGASTAQAAWNTYPSDCPVPLTIGNYTTGDGIQNGSNGCWTKTNVSASAGQTINVAVFYDNTNGTNANNTVISLTQSPAGSMSSANSAYTFSGSLNSSAGSLNLNQVSTNLTTSQTLTFSAARVFKMGSSNGEMLPGGQTGNEAFNGGLSLGTIADGDWGTVIFSFTVGSTVAPQTCQDPSASNYGGALPCTYPQATCQDPSATNFRGPLPCTYPPQKCMDYTASNYGGPLPCKYPPQVCQDYSASNYGGPLPCTYPPQKCMDYTASNFGGPLPCTYPVKVCQDYTASNYGGPLPCKYPPQTCSDQAASNYGGSLPCTYPIVKNCVISNFTASSTTVNTGGSSTLSWNTKDCNSASISELGSVPLSGSYVVYPGATTTYVLSAYGQNGNNPTVQTRSVTISVNSAASTNGSITSNPQRCTVPVGGSKCNVTISWNTVNPTPQNVSAVTRDANVTLTRANSGSRSVQVDFTGETFYLSHNGVILDQTRADAVCATNSTWDGSTCVTTQVLACIISNFTASSTFVQAGQPVTLTWNTVNCESVDIEGVSMPTSGSITIYPPYTATLLLSAYGQNGNVKTKSLTINVGNNTPPPTSNCYITNFTASPTFVTSGQSSTLLWNTTGCTTASISSVGSVPVSGSQIVHPYGTMTYVLTAYGPNGGMQQTQSVTVTVNNQQQNNCYISNFTASPTFVNSGQQTTLSWNTQNCVSATVSGPGMPTNTSLSGSQTVYPYSSGSYTITAYSASGAPQTQTVYVTVNNNNQQQNTCYISSFFANPSSVNQGSPATLTWNTSGCTSVSISGVGSVGLSGSQLIYPSFSTNYVLTAYGYNSGQQSQTVYVTVNPVTQQPVQVNSCAVTTVATNVTTNSAQVNGLISNPSAYNGTAYFEYGPTVTMGSQTVARAIGGVSSFSEFLTNLTPDRIYYYRLVSNCGGTLSRGAIEIFSTRAVVVSGGGGGTIVRPTIVQGTTIIGTESPIMLRIENRYEFLGVGDTIDYTVTYRNIGRSLLTRPILQVVAPKGVTLTNASRGTYSVDTNTLTVQLEDLFPGSEGVVYLQGRVDSLAVGTAQIVTTAILVYTSPNGAQENAIAYVLNKPKDLNTSLLGASAFFTGFFPGSLIGWLLLLILILLIILLARRYGRRAPMQAGYANIPPQPPAHH